MVDIAHAYDSDLMAADLLQDGGALASDSGLYTAVVISLFTDRRAGPDDELPSGAGSSKRGWWGDAIPVRVGGEEMEGDRIGSRLWLLAREKVVPEVLARAKEYAEEALAWLIEDGIADRVEVETMVVRTNVLGLGVIIHRPTGNAVDFRFDNIWASEAQRSAS